MSRPGPACAAGRRAALRTASVVVLSLALVGNVWAKRAATRDRPLTPEEWATELRARGFDPQTLQNPLAYNAEMQREAQRVAGGGETDIRLQRLQTYLFERANPFDYEQLGTATAQEAFVKRAGDCVAFTNLFIALSRAIGIPAMPALVSGEASEQDDDLILINKHIVAYVEQGIEGEVFDFYHVRGDPIVGIRPISDIFMTAIYQSNLGVRALKEGHADTAEGFFDAAIRLNPSFVSAYANLGVARRRQGDLAGALDAYLMGLQLAPKDHVLRDNLVHWLNLTRQRATTTPANDFERKLAAGDAAFAEGRNRRAARRYRQAQRLEPDRAESWVALARVDLLRNRLDAAARLLGRALELAPEQAHARRLLEGIQRLREVLRAGPARAPVQFSRRSFRPSPPDL